MSELIVLGLIPGTHLQITFIFWIALVILVAVLSLVWLAHRLHVFRNWLITVRLLMLTRRPVRA